MTHDELVERATRWLKGTMSCGVVLCEVVGGGYEQPDAIGWKHGGRHSILVECKTSRSDFRKDLKKWFRRHGMGMGQQRYYFTPPGLLKPDEIPDGWGLAEAGGRVRVTKKLPKLECYNPDVWRLEIGLLFSALRKVELRIPVDRAHWGTEDLAKLKKKAACGHGRGLCADCGWHP